MSAWFYVDMMVPTAGKRHQNIVYSQVFLTLLMFVDQRVIYRHGHPASGGHYTLDVLHPNRYPGAKAREG